MLTRLPFHYGFAVLFSCIVCLFTSVAFSINVSGIFFPSLAQAFGVGRGAVSTYYAFLWLAATISLPLWGSFFEKLDARLCMTIATCLIGISLWGLSFASSLTWVFLWAFVIGLGFPLLLFIATPTLVLRWFAHRIGLMTGIAMAFLGAGAFLFNYLGGILINEFGWQITYRLFALITLVSTLPFTLLVVRSKTEDIGVLKCWVDRSHLAGPERSLQAVASIPAKRAYRTFRFWAIIIFTLFTNFCMYAYLMTPSYISELSIGIALPLLASTVAALYSLGQFVAKLVFGVTVDRQPLITGIIALSLGVMGIVGYLLFTSSAALLVLSGVFLGFYGATTNVLLPSFTAYLFGTIDFSRIYAKVSMAASVAGVLQPLTLGWVYDNYGSSTMLIVVIAFIMLSYFFMIGALRSGRAAASKKK
jgi:MFS family permease